MASNHGLRTTGTHTGNFGRAKVQGKRDTLDLTKEILTKDNLRIPNRDDAFSRLVEAYNTTTDPRLKAGLWDILRTRRAALQEPVVKPMVKPTSEFAEYCRLTR